MIFLCLFIKEKETTKDGKCWIFRVCYKEGLNNNKRYISKKYATKTEVKAKEKKFLNELESDANTPSKMTIGDLWNNYLEYQQDKVRLNTYKSYQHTELYIKSLFNVKCSDFNINHFEKWKEIINNC